MSNRIPRSEVKSWQIESKWYISVIDRISEMLKEIVEEREQMPIPGVTTAIGADHGNFLEH